MTELKRRLPMATPGVATLLLLVGLTGCTGGGATRHSAAAASTPPLTRPSTSSTSTPTSRESPTPPASSTSPTSPASSVLGVGTVHQLLGALATPRGGRSSGFTYHFEPAVLSGSSTFGDFGSAAWNIDYASRRGNGTWAAQLYVFEKASQARFTLAHSSAAQRLCASRPVPVAGFVKAGARTVAVACQGPESRPGWWLIVDRADQQTWLIMATNLPSRELATAAAKSIMASLGTTITQAEVALHKLSLPS